MDWDEYVAKRDSNPSGIRKYKLIYEAWKTHYPEMNAPQIAISLGIPVSATKDFVSQLNATEGDFDKAYVRLISYIARSNLRRIIRDQPDHVNILEIIDEEARLTKLIANLKTNYTPEPIEIQIAAIRQKEAKWLASGIPDPIETFEPVKKRGVGKHIASIDREEPGLTATEVAKRVGTTADSVRSFRYSQRKERARKEREWQASGIDG